MAVCLWGALTSSPQIVASMLRVASKGFKANVHQGADVHHVRLAPAVEFLVLETVRLCGLDIAGVDLLVGQEAYFVCEINSSPGFEGLERATLVDVAEEVSAMASLFSLPPLSIRAHRRRSSTLWCASGSSERLLQQRLSQCDPYLLRTPRLRELLHGPILSIVRSPGVSGASLAACGVETMHTSSVSRRRHF
jgi:hypothetical protein